MKTSLPAVLAAILLSLPACATEAGRQSDVTTMTDVDDLYARLGEPSRMEILADGRSVLTWDSASSESAHLPVEEFASEPARGCYLRVVVAADNTIADQRIEAAPGNVRCAYFDAFNAAAD